ncbi:MAG: TonB-dependent receptor [Bacteroidota bacterium]
MCTKLSFSQIKVQGVVQDSTTGEVLIGALVSINTTHVITNSYGSFSAFVNPSLHTVEVSYIGYKTYTATISFTHDTIVQFVLVPDAINLGVVTVSADFTKNALTCKQIPVSQIIKTTTSFGEPDVIKVMQIQPGIKNIGDGSSGMYIRGGNKDQNLVYIDEVSLYSISHMYGFVSACNPFLLQNVKLYTSYIPAEYGGRVSSVLDMQLKEGNKKQYSSLINVSTLSTNIGIEGPIKKDTSSFFIAFRNSNLNYFLKDLELPVFRDFIAKTNVSFNKKHTLYISTYNSIDDEQKEESNAGLTQSNHAIIMRWVYKPFPNIFINTTGIINNYNTKSKQDSIKNAEETFNTIAWETGVKDYILKTKIDWLLNSAHRITFGGGSMFRTIIPGTAQTIELSIPNMKILESSLFVEDNIHISTHWKSQIGVRYMTYQNIGKAVWYRYDENFMPITTQTETAGIWNTYHSIEPRARVAYHTSHSEISLSYTRTSQGMQTLSNNTLSYSNMETWISSSPNIKPLVSNAVSLGYSYTHRMYSFLIETYVKSIENQIDYIDHAQLFGNPYIETQIRKGRASAYGIETSLQKKQGKLTGQASYTYSRVQYTIPGITKNETYNAPYDLPHDCKIQLSYSLLSQFTLGAVWVFTSGRPTTVPIGGMLINYSEFPQVEPKLVPIYSERNSVRMPDYHRLDISCSYHWKPRTHIEQSVSFTLFNAYGQENPLYYDVNFSENSYVYYSFKFLPSISYNAKIK